MRKTLLFLVGVLAVGCGQSTGPAIPQDQTASQAKADLNARLDKANLPPEARERANQQLDAEMMATQARRAASGQRAR